MISNSFTGGVQFAVLLDEAGCHLGVAMDFSAFVAFQLESAGMFHSLGNVCRAFRIAPVGKVAVFDRRNFNMDVDPVQQRTGDA
jgi:hypothetical protein